MAVAMSTPTTSKAKSPTCSASPTICATASTTAQRMKGSKNEFASASTRLNASVHGLPKALPHNQRKNPDPSWHHLIMSTRVLEPEGIGFYGHLRQCRYDRSSSRQKSARRYHRRPAARAESRAKHHVDP